MRDRLPVLLLLGRRLGEEVVVKAMNMTLKTSEETYVKLMKNIEEVIAGNNTKEIETIDEVIACKQQELLEQVRAKKDYTDIANEVETLKCKKHKMLVKKALDEDKKRRIKDMEEFLKSQNREITEYDEELVRKYIKQIKIYDDMFEIKFKSGIEINIERIRID